jgi:EPS-associated MarR family transcriptional regulator
MSSENQHLQLLKLLQTHPHLNQRELAEKMGVSLGKVNYCMRALIEKGLVKLENFRQAESKRKYAYLLTPAGIAEKSAITARFMRSKVEEYERLKAEIELLRQEMSGNASEAKFNS